MAFKVWDGWDHYTAQQDMEQRSGFLQYFTFANAPAFTFVTGRNGNGKALRTVINGTGLQFVYADRNPEAIVGQAVFHEVAGGTIAGLNYAFMDTTVGLNGTPQVTVHFNRLNYSIEIWQGASPLLGGFSTGTLLFASPNNVWTSNVWNFVEIWLKVNNSTGLVKVHVNGVEKVNQTGLDTQVTANAWWDAQYIAGTGTPGINSFIIDDHYYEDMTTGAGTFAANTFAGDAKVVTLFATGNDSVQWTPLANTNWQEISEIAMDSDTSYNSDTVAGHQDTFTFGALANTITTIYGIQLTYAARKDDAGSRVTKSVVKIAGTSYFGANQSLPDTNYAYFTDMWILNPNTSANWILAGVNGADYGYNLVS